MAGVMKLAVPPALTSSSNNSVITANRVTGLETPVTGEDATNKTYVDASAAGVVAGLDTEIQFNDTGVMAGDASLTWDGAILSATDVATEGVQLVGSTSGFMNIAPAAAVTSYTITFPAAQGGAATTLQNDGAGNLTWV